MRDKFKASLIYLRSLFKASLVYLQSKFKTSFIYLQGMVWASLTYTVQDQLGIYSVFKVRQGSTAKLTQNKQTKQKFSTSYMPIYMVVHA